MNRKIVLILFLLSFVIFASIADAEVPFAGTITMHNDWKSTSFASRIGIMVNRAQSSMTKDGNPLFFTIDNIQDCDTYILSLVRSKLAGMDSAHHGLSNNLEIQVDHRPPHEGVWLSEVIPDQGTFIYLAVEDGTGLIEEMKDGMEVQVSLTVVSGTKVIHRYSLDGSGDAITHAEKFCEQEEPVKFPDPHLHDSI